MKNQVIIPDNDKKDINISEEKIAIVMALYYREDADKYFNYLSIIPEDISVFVISSNQDILQKGKSLKLVHKNLYIIEKDNRGRDLSALLVAFYPYVCEYTYLCFVHDKKAKHPGLEADISLWIENLWDNLLYSKNYILKVIDLLKNEGYGLLLPPKPMGIYKDSMYTNPWDNDYDNVVQLARTINMNIEIDKKDTESVSLGSAFWCQTKALGKLFAHNWTYEEFPEEPMPDDGTISHAIERIFGFVTADAGYKTAVIMNTEYASKMIGLLQSKLQYTYEWLWDNAGIKNTYQLSKYYEEKEMISDIFSKGQVYLYGAGDYGIQYFQKLKIWGYRPEGFIVSDGMKKCESLCGIPVKELSKVDKEAFIIITTNPALQDLMASNLEDKGFSNYYKAVCM